MVEISSDKNLLDLNIIHSFLSNSYWNKGITPENVQTCIDNSLNFGMYKNGKQIGYARVVTDYFRFAYLLDVFIIESEQAKGYGKDLMDYIFSQKELANIQVWKLGTKDAHSLYEKYGFTALEYPENMMERKN